MQIGLRNGHQALHRLQIEANFLTLVFQAAELGGVAWSRPVALRPIRQNMPSFRLNSRMSCCAMRMCSSASTESAAGRRAFVWRRVSREPGEYLLQTGRGRFRPSTFKQMPAQGTVVVVFHKVGALDRRCGWFISFVRQVQSVCALFRRAWISVIQRAAIRSCRRSRSLRARSFMWSCSGLRSKRGTSPSTIVCRNRQGPHRHKSSARVNLNLSEGVLMRPWMVFVLTVFLAWGCNSAFAAMSSVGFRCSRFHPSFTGWHAGRPQDFRGKWVVLIFLSQGRNAGTTIRPATSSVISRIRAANASGGRSQCGHHSHKDSVRRKA